MRRRWPSSWWRPRRSRLWSGRWRPHPISGRGQVRIRLVDLLEAFRGFLDVRGVAVGVVHQGELAEGLLDRRVVGRVGQAQGLEVLCPCGLRHGVTRRVCATTLCQSIGPRGAGGVRSCPWPVKPLGAAQGRVAAAPRRRAPSDSQNRWLRAPDRSVARHRAGNRAKCAALHRQPLGPAPVARGRDASPARPRGLVDMS